MLKFAWDDMGGPREIELKLELEASDAERLRELPFLRRRSGRAKQHLRSVYFDTPKRVLGKAGVSLRIRTVKGRHLQTLKASDGAAAGLFDRQEWEHEVARPEPDLAAATNTTIGGIVRRRAVRKNLRPVFETIVERTIRRISRDGAQIELALDEGEVRAGPDSAPLCSLELELKKGPVEALFAVARSCNEAVPLRLEVVSKSERGYALLEGRRTRVAKAEPVQLDREMSAAEGFQAIMRSCIRHFRLNEPVLLDARETEALHQARIAIRRLRSALSLFKDMIADGAVDDLKDRLRTFSRELGEARNLDVFLADILAPGDEDSGGEPGATSLLAYAKARREAAYDRVVATMVSQDFRQLMLDLAAWTEHGPWISSEDSFNKGLRERLLADLAIELLDAWRRKVKNKGRNLKRLDPAKRHRTRIAAKKLRYASEFVAQLYDTRKLSKRHQAFVEALQELQTQLGELNDIVAGERLAETLAHDAARAASGVGDGEAAFSAGLAAGKLDKDVDTLLDGAAKAHAQFVAAEPFWR
ncbi:MAG: CYTH and CHAD domain-containing protein [Methylobacteriaceae bacterium]|nr:CYTH and CHAD domain-containing protein [Methylobacteriaceae bacterium]